MLAAAPAVVADATAPAAWLLSPEEAESRLWSLYSSAPLPQQLCSGELFEGLACLAGEAGTWDELSGINRPLLLDMITPQRFAAAVLFLGAEGRTAWVAATEGIVELELGELGLAWTGRYRLLWHPPDGFSGPLGLGDESPVVSQIASLFARLDGQQKALSGTLFSPVLQARVRMFQRENGLLDDGVVGVQTLLKINEALGIDLTNSAARKRLAQVTEEVVVR
jgi:general secretion pathway protein A